MFLVNLNFPEKIGEHTFYVQIVFCSLSEAITEDISTIKCDTDSIVGRNVSTIFR